MAWKAIDTMAKGLAWFAMIALVPALIFGWLLLGEISLRSDLRERGVRTPMLERDICSSGVRQRVCAGTARYAVRPEHGGGVREATFYRYLYEPVAVYDPENPDRALSPADLEAGPSNGYYAGIVIPLGFSLLFAGLAFGDVRKRRRPPRPGPEPGSADDYRGPGSGALIGGAFSRDGDDFRVRRAVPAEAAAAPPVEAREPAPAAESEPPLDRVAEVRLGGFKWRLPRRSMVRAPGPPPEPPGPDPRVPILEDLLRLVQRMSGPSRELDWQIYEALFGRPGPYGYQCNRPAGRTETYDDDLNRSLPPPHAPTCPKFTANAEAAMLLIPWHFSTWGYVDDDPSVHEVALGHAPRGVRAQTAPLAICAAVIAHYVEYPQELRRNL